MGELALLNRAWAAGWAPPDRRSIVEWAAENITLPTVLTISGRFNPHVSRHFLPIFEALQDDLCRFVTLLKPVDSGGTLIGDIWTLWVVVNDPGAMLLTFQNEDAVKRHAENRLNVMLDNCEPCRELFPLNRNLKRIQEILFRNGMPLYMQGPSLGNLQSQRIRYLRNEEIWLWPNGLRAEALGRIRNWEEIGMSKVFEPSQGGVEFDDLDQLWRLGTQEEWSVACRSCGKYCEASWGGKRPDGSRYGIVWDDNERTRRDKTGEWNMAELLPTVRWECFHCGFPHLFEQCREDWNRLGRYQAANPEAAPKRRSFHFDSIILRSWQKQVEDFLRAVQAYRIGIEEPLRQIIQKERARPWSDTYAPADRRSETYDLSKPLDVEGESCLTFDTHDEGIFPSMVVTWAADGKAYVRHYGTCYSEGDLKALQAQYKIPPAWVMGDSGWGATTRDVYRMCARNGWIACKGADEASFTHYFKRNNRTIGVEKSWKSFKGDPEMGRAGQHRVFAMGLRWSNFTIKSRLKRLIDRGHWIEPSFNVEDRNWKAYQEEMGSEKLIITKRRTDGKQIQRFVRIRANEAWDCACLAVLFATVRGRLADFQLDKPEVEESAKN